MSKTCVLNERNDVTSSAVRMTFVRFDRDIDRADSIARDRFGSKLPTIDVELFEAASHVFDVSASGDEGAQRHVACDAVKRMDPDRRHDDPSASCRMRIALTAAPYPLSMPTTFTPAEHEANMPSKAVTPSSPAP